MQCLQRGKNHIWMTTDKREFRRVDQTRADNYLNQNQQMLSYRRDRAAGCVIVFAKSRRLELGTIFYEHYRSIFNHCDIIGLKICRIRWKKRKIKAVTAFKVIQSHRGRYKNRKPVCDFLLVINSNWHPISYRFRDIAVYCSNFGTLHFRATLWGLRDNVRYSFWAHWKGRSGLPINVNWTFSLGATAESLRAKRNRKSAISLQCRQNFM